MKTDIAQWGKDHDRLVDAGDSLHDANEMLLCAIMALRHDSSDEKNAVSKVLCEAIARIRASLELVNQVRETIILDVI